MIIDLEYGVPPRTFHCKTNPMEHQLDALKRFIDEPYGGLLCEMGTGKTKIVLDIIGNSPEKGCLMAAPNGLHLNWDAIEIPKHFVQESSVYCWRGKPTTIRAKAEWAQFMQDDSGKFKFFLINIEAIRTEAGFSHAHAFLKSMESSHFVIDESTCIKNPKAQQTKAALKLAKMCDRKWILNGTPITQGPLDVFSQCKFLNKDALPYSTFTAFKAMFAIEHLVQMQNRSFRQISGYKNLERLKEELAPFSLRLLKEDCMDLPEKVFTAHVVELTKEQKKIYAQIKDLCMAQLNDGTIASTTIALTKITKLHQILTGFVTNDEGEEVEIPSNRISSLLQIAESASPLVIFCAYRNNVTQVAKALRDKYGPDSVVEYHGGTSKEGRTNAVQAFQEGTANFFIGTSAAAKGITLHRSNTTVYFSNNRSLETRLQSQDRVHRFGQERKCTYIDLVAPNTLDEVIIQSLLAKKDLADMVLTDLNKIIENA